MTAFESEICPRCGNPRFICSDSDRDWYPQRSMCYPTAALDLARRKIEKLYEKKQPTATDLHPTDGMSVWMSADDLTPDDNFLDDNHEREDFLSRRE